MKQMRQKSMKMKSAYTDQWQNMRGVWISVDDSPRLSGGDQVFIIHGNGQQADYLEHISRHTTQPNIPGQLCTSDIFAMILQFAFRFW